VAIFTEKLLTYALGREVEYYDYPAIRRIMQEGAGNDYRWSSVLVGIVKSMPFQMSVVRSAPPQNEVASQYPQRTKALGQLRSSAK